MLKKMLCLLLAVTVLVACAACGVPAEENPVADNKETVPATQEKEEPTQKVEEEAPAPEITFTEQVLVDDENCTVKITGIEDDSIWGYTLKVYLENKTDLELMFSVDGVSVNGYMCDPFWGSSVTAGMKSNEEISFSAEAFERNGITTPTDIQFKLRVSDYNDWMAEPLVDQEFAVYPMGEEAVQVYERADQPEDIVLFDNEWCKMVVTGFEQDDIWGYSMNVYLENKTDKEMMFSADGVAVNGFMCDPFWGESVMPGKRSNTSITWSKTTFEEKGITEVEEIVLPIRVTDYSDWAEEPFVEESFTVNP